MVVLAQAGAAVGLLLAGAWLLGTLLVVGAVAVLFCAVRISRAVGRSSLPPTSTYVERVQEFW